MKRYTVYAQIQDAPDFRVLTAHPALTPEDALIDGVQKYKIVGNPHLRFKGATVSEDES